MISNDTSLPDYKAKYFEFKEHDKIHDKPTFDKLIHLFHQLKTNAHKVPTTLGGGNQGYLTLVLSGADYNAIPTTNIFVRPVDLVIFNPTTLSGCETNAQIAHHKAVHEEALQLFNEVQEVGKVLKYQLLNVIDDEYIDALQSNTMVNLSLPDIMNYLTHIYGQITEEEFKREQFTILNFW